MVSMHQSPDSSLWNTRQLYAGDIGEIRLAICISRCWCWEVAAARMIVDGGSGGGGFVPILLREGFREGDHKMQERPDRQIRCSVRAAMCRIHIGERAISMLQPRSAMHFAVRNSCYHMALRRSTYRALTRTCILRASCGLSRPMRWRLARLRGVTGTMKLCHFGQSYSLKQEHSPGTVALIGISIAADIFLLPRTVSNVQESPTGRWDIGLARGTCSMR